jgi:phage FluMu protein gp41
VENKKPHPLGFEFDGGFVIGSLKHGLSLEGVVQKTFKMRDSTVDDLLSAEGEADVDKPLNFNSQLMARQLVSVGSFEGPFTMNMIRRLKKHDWRILRAAQTELDTQGEAEPASEKAS